MARRGYSKRSSEVALPLPTSRAALVRSYRAARDAESCLAGFKLEIAKMRSEGATQAEIDRMLDESEEVYAPDEDAEGKLVVWRFSGKLFGFPASGHKLPIA